MPRRTDSPLARVDLGRTVAFTFDGRALTGHPGDTLASALLANEVRVVGRSTYLGRPRGILSAGVEEPNAFVELDLGTHTQPSARATTVELYEGLTARSLAGRGRAGGAPDPSRYAKTEAHCDVLVIGGGAAGIAAAGAAAETGARVILLDEQPELGGALLHTGEPVEGHPAARWLADAGTRLDAAPDVAVVRRATALGVFDAGYVIAAERRTEHLPPDHAPHRARQRLWHVRARRIVLATGAIERPIVFADNDRPGVMLAGAAWTYAARYAAAPGRRAVVFTTNDSAYAAAARLLEMGVEIAALVDARPAPPPGLGDDLRARGVAIHTGAAVVRAVAGEEGVTAARIAPIDEAGRPLGAAQDVLCDLIAVSGGWTPTLHLYAQAGGRLGYDAALAAHVPAGSHERVAVAGAAAGTTTLAEAFDQGVAAGSELPFAVNGGRGRASAARPLWAVAPENGGWDTHFVDIQRDASAADLQRAVGAGLRSPEHIKRYTSIGTGPDQGKTSNLNAIGIVAGLLDVPVESLAPTTYRPPFSPVPFAVLAGRERGTLREPVRVTAMHPWHVEHGALFEDVGQWKRPAYYPEPGEDMAAAIRRECAAVRTGVGIMDASTLGKIDVQGPDAAELLDRIYTNLMSAVPVGMCRYGLLCATDGTIMDDGVVLRLAEDRYMTTTTTGNAARVMDWLEEWLQTEWPDLDVRLTSVTDHWAVMAIAGPRARAVVAALAPDVATDAASMPFMAIREARVAGVPARLCRISFSGELAYEVHVPARYALAAWEAAMAAGAEHGIAPYGLEALHVLRAEKGYVVVGQDTDSTVTPHDAGMAWAVSTKKDFFVGRRSQRRADLVRPDRRQLVGLLSEDPRLRLPEGSQLLRAGEDSPRTAGHVTSSYDSGALGRTFALALLEGGHERLGETIDVAVGDRTVRAVVTGSVFYDPEGERRDGDPAQRD